MKSFKFAQCASTVTLAICAIGIATPASAQVEEIVVTAQKREQSLKDVPAAVTAMTGEVIRENNITDPRDLFEGIPNVAVKSTAAAGQVQLSFRGVSYSTFSPVGVQPVMVYQDEVAQSSPQTAGLFIFDNERIEVVRGPQNTLYGRNSTGGAVNYISKRPRIGAGTNGYADLTVGDSSTINFEGAIGFDIGDSAAFRLSGQSLNNSGYWKNLHFPDDRVGKTHQHMIRAQLALEPSANTKLLFNLHGGTRRGEQRPYKSHGLTDPVTGGACTDIDLDDFRTTCVDAGGNPTNPNTDEVYVGMRNNLNNIDAFGGSVRFDLTTDNFDFLSITAHEQNKSDVWEDDDGIEFDSTNFFVKFRQRARTEQWSQEFRLTSNSKQRFRWITGVYGFVEKVDYETALPILMLFSDAGKARQNTRMLSVFGDVKYDIADRLTINVGARYLYEKQYGRVSATHADFTLAPGGGLDAEQPNLFLFDSLLRFRAPPVGISPTRLGNDVVDAPYGKSWNMWGGKIGLEYKTDSGALFYASVTRGQKGGQFTDSPDAVLQGVFFTPVDPETIVSYEAGFKHEWFDRKLQTYLALFHVDYKNQQDQISIPTAAGGVSATVVNVGDSRINGAEFEARLAPGGGWNFNLGMGWLDTKVTRDAVAARTGGVASIEVGRNLANAPKFTANFGVSKEFDLGGDTRLKANVNGSYSSSVELRLTDTAATRVLGTNPPDLLLNAFLALNFGPNGKYRVSVWGKNLTDELVIHYTQEFGVGSIMGIPGDPRRFGVTFGVDF